MSKSICVFCSSSDAVEDGYQRLAAELGARLAERGHTLVFVGAEVGMMATAARAARKAGGRVVGVIPQMFEKKGIAFGEADELIVTGDLRERKTVMEERSDAFIALPGGFGTLEELLEMLTMRQLGRHSKPIVLLSADGFFGPLLEMFERLYERRFAKPQYREMYRLESEPAAALDYIETHEANDAAPMPEKWTG